MSFVGIVLFYMMISRSEISPATPLSTPAAVSTEGLSDAKIIETNALPLSILTTETFAWQHSFEPGAGALQVVDGRILIMDRLGHFFYFEKNSVQPAAILDLPMNIEDYRKNARFPLDESTLRTHDLKYSRQHQALFATFEQYSPALDSTQFSLARWNLKSPKPSWEMVYQSTPIRSVDYYSGRGAGGKMVLSRDQLYLALGDYNLDGGENLVAQDDTSDFGKVYVIDLSTGKKSKISKGHRVPQRMAISDDGTLWLTEHGPRGGDKLIKVKQGKNYGWPFTTLGARYFTVGPLANTPPKGFKGDLPFYSWVPSIAPTSLIQLRDFHESWDSDLLVGSLKAQSLFRIRVENDRVLYVEQIWIGKRIRDFVQLVSQIVILTDDGSLVFVTPQTDLKLAERIASENVYKNPIFESCVNCHSFSPDYDLPWGPNLHDIFERKIASSNFRYSKALLSRQGSWSESALMGFLLQTQMFAPGNTMPNTQLTPERAMKIVEALKSQHK